MIVQTLPTDNRTLVTLTDRRVACALTDNRTLVTLSYGAAVIPSGPGVGVDNLLLEDGTNLLLEDGTSVLLLEA